MITLYLMGNPAKYVPPLKTLNAADVKRFDRQGADLSRMKVYEGRGILCNQKRCLETT